jgi:hypothetical protein
MMELSDPAKLQAALDALKMDPANLSALAMKIGGGWAREWQNGFEYDKVKAINQFNQFDQMIDQSIIIGFSFFLLF